MSISLYPYQIMAIDKLRTGSILCGGVGSGKSRTAIAYYFLKECGGKIKINGEGEFKPMQKPKDLYIITTAKKRDTLEWEHECSPFSLTTHEHESINQVKIIVDSWNNIKKYTHVKDSFFIFDEQRLVGSGTWVKSFLKIVKHNNWILLSATPGDTWMDYIPVFLANGFYKNRTEFLRQHAVYNRFTKYPQVESYIGLSLLEKQRDNITVIMNYEKTTNSINRIITTEYDKIAYKTVMVKRWNIFKDKPISAISELCYLLRKVVNSDPSRLEAITEIFKTHSKLIIFYNFDYELDMLKNLALDLNVSCAEWNGHKHESIPKAKKWFYLVQYTAGAEGWNCIETDTIVFYSQNYSYKSMVQAAGRIDRLNTPFKDLYYYHIKSNASIDLAIARSLKTKKNFNVRAFAGTNVSREKHML